MASLWVLLFSLLITTQLCLSPLAHSHSALSDQQALLGLKRGSTFDPNNSLANWTPSLPFCNWTGWKVLPFKCGECLKSSMASPGIFARKLLFVCIVMGLVFLMCIAIAQTEHIEDSDLRSHGKGLTPNHSLSHEKGPNNGNGGSHVNPPIIDCNSACKGRCEDASRCNRWIIIGPSAHEHCMIAWAIC